MKEIQNLKQRELFWVSSLMASFGPKTCHFSFQQKLEIRPSKKNSLGSTKVLNVQIDGPSTILQF